jgi:predicted DNA-binding transcriptional regulator AlpA
MIESFSNETSVQRHSGEPANNSVTPTKHGAAKSTITMGLAEAAAILGVGRTTCWTLYRRGVFPVPVLKIGGSLRIVRAHLDQFLATGEHVESGKRIDANSSAD